LLANIFYDGRLVKSLIIFFGILIIYSLFYKISWGIWKDIYKEKREVVYYIFNVMVQLVVWGFVLI